MFHLNKLFRYPIKRRKRSLFSAFCLLAVIYAGFQIVYFEDEYSPLQLLSSVESEASRLLHFITQAQIQCNSSTPTSNVSFWLICQDMMLEVPPDLSAAKGIVYSIGPGFDSSFEQLIDKNSSYQLYIFSPFKRKQWETFSNHTSIVHTSIVPDDPSDFARNSYQTQTLNSVHKTLGHGKINIVKIDNQLDVIHSHELLHFLIKGSWLANVKELHFVLQLDKVEEDDIYNWYRVLYSLFHKSGFRLYHTAASNSLCLQDTIMESCKYYLSWLKDVPPQAFVLYPPAIDGSMGYEEDRMTEHLEEISRKRMELFPITLKLTRQHGAFMRKKNGTRPQDQLFEIKLAKKVVPNTHSCTILFILNSHIEHVQGLEETKCAKIFLKPVFDNSLGMYTFQKIFRSNSRTRKINNALSAEDVTSLLGNTKVNIMVLETGESWDSWGPLMTVLSQGIAKSLDELILQTSIFQHHPKSHPMVLRKKYSAMKQIQTYGLVGVDWKHQINGKALEFRSNQDVDTLNFVKSKYIS